jgi:hypothetical protein
VLFDRICRHNGVGHLLTAPSSPNQNGKVERFHGTFRPDFLDDAGPFASAEAAQVATDGWVGQYNTDRPHQGLDERVPVTPAQRFAPIDPAEREVVELWLPPTLQPVTNDDPAPMSATDLTEQGGAVELDKVVPGSGTISIGGQQFWFGPRRAGQLVRFWN